MGFVDDDKEDVDLCRSKAKMQPTPNEMFDKSEIKAVQ